MNSNQNPQVMYVKSSVFVFFMIWAPLCFSQVGEYSGINGNDDLEAFYAETKQVNQFFRRFNAEESQRGIKLSTRDSLYHNRELRQQFIPLLFDREEVDIPGLLKDAFIHDVTLPDDPKYLDFHGDDWFAEVVVMFRKGSNDIYITLLMKLVKENLGSKWVIDDVRYNPYEGLYASDHGSASRFLHPLSHELDFMNLDKVFREKQHTGDYFKKDFRVSKLSIFLYELRNGTLQFEYVTNVKFHFFQIGGWYFEISEFNRPGLNRGWLISNLIRLEEGQKESLINYLYNLD